MKENDDFILKNTISNKKMLFFINFLLKIKFKNKKVKNNIQTFCNFYL